MSISSLATSALTELQRGDPDSVTRLPAPARLRESHPLSHEVREQIAAHRQHIAAALKGTDSRLLVIVGPCSIHHVDEALAYADRLAAVAERLSSELIVAMRVYVEKPRSTVGWRGLVFDPSLDGSQGAVEGLVESRRVLCGVAARGLPVATESLDPFVLPFVEDTLSFTSLGARTSESQTHRQMAAAAPCPVGLKNATDGGLDVAADGAVAVSSPQSAFSLALGGEPVHRSLPGNPDTALVLRGGSNGPNFSEEWQRRGREMRRARGLNDAVVIDCSHGNSGKVASRQLEVVAYLCDQIRRGNSRPAGIMLESYHRHGRQEAAPLCDLQPGVSVTDECIGFEETEQVLEQLADAIQTTRIGALESQPAPV